MNLRLKKLRKRLPSWKVDALLITVRENVRYLSGFTGSSGSLILTRQEAYFLTDSRYATQARDEVKGVRIKIYKREIEDTVSFIKRLRLKRLGFEARGIIYETYGKLKDGLHGKRLVPLSKDIEGIRSVKDTGEIRHIKRAARLASIGFQTAINRIIPGSVESEVALDAEMAMKKNGAQGLSFDIIVASGKRGALPHGKASDKKIRKSEFVIVDLGARYNGYHSDETCTFVVGRAGREQKRVYQIVKDAHDMAIDAVRPGVKASSIDAAARDFIKKTGYGKYFGHGAGHGVGLAVHEWPSISPYSDVMIEEGMVFTIEPGIYIPQWGGVRIEDMVLVTRSGCEVLTEMSKEMTVL